MENTNEMQAILAQIEKNTAKQARRGSLQCILTGVAVLCCIGILVMLSTLANRVDAVAGKVDALTEQTEKLQEDVSDLIGQVELILTNAVDVTQQLADADLQGLV